MNENRRQILEMLAAGRITADEAERLLAALEPAPATAGPGYGGAGNTGAKAAGARAKYLRVLVEADESVTGNKGLTTVNVRVPMQLLRAGVRLGALIPPKARDEVNAAMAREGIPFDINQLKPENLDDLIDHLGDMTVDVDSGDAKVRVYCE